MIPPCLRVLDSLKHRTPSPLGPTDRDHTFGNTLCASLSLFYFSPFYWSPFVRYNAPGASGNIRRTEGNSGMRQNRERKRERQRKRERDGEREMANFIELIEVRDRRTFLVDFVDNRTIRFTLTRDLAHFSRKLFLLLHLPVEFLLRYLKYEGIAP